MKYVQSARISGEINAPASKSMMQRAVLAGACARGETIIDNSSYCNDALASISVAKCLGAKIDLMSDKLCMSGSLSPAKQAIHCGESGLCMRITCALASLFESEIVIDGEGSLCKRPVDMIISPLEQLGVRCQSRDGFLPVRVQGPMQGSEIRVDAGTSSQFLSGLLMALPLCEKDSVIHVTALKSKPYISMTLELLSAFGVKVDASTDYSEFRIPGSQHYRPATLTIEGDWSGASFLLVAGAIAGSVDVRHLSPDSTQADVAILDALKSAGARIEWKENLLSISRNELKSFSFNASDCPDLFPPLVALASYCDGTSRIEGTERLLHKESNRAETLFREFSRLGAGISLCGNCMEIKGGLLHSARVDSHNDHRIAMACAVAGLGIEGGVEIDGEDCVAKSYPEFFDVLTQISGKQDPRENF